MSHQTSHNSLSSADNVSSNKTPAFDIEAQRPFGHPPYDPLVSRSRGVPYTAEDRREYLRRLQEDAVRNGSAGRTTGAAGGQWESEGSVEEEMTGKSEGGKGVGAWWVVRAFDRLIERVAEAWGQSRDDDGGGLLVRYMRDGMDVEV